MSKKLEDEMDFVPFFDETNQVIEYDFDNDRSRFLPEEMFSMNASKSSFNLNDYTVPIDKNASNYEELVKTAERIATEIKENPNSQYNKENSLEHENEELMFSAVNRSAVEDDVVE